MNRAPNMRQKEGSAVQFRVGIIGCGRRPRTEGSTGSGLGHVHAGGYERSPDCRIAAAADIRKDNLDPFCEEHHIPHGYLDYREMLAKEELDIVSVCVWPGLHAQMVIDAAKAGVSAIHCEKPMAPTWGEAKTMAAVCQEHNAQLTIGHHRRFVKPFRKAKKLYDDGRIGQLIRLEAFTHNLFDWGTHWFDMMFFYNNEEPVEWVMGQIEGGGGRSIFGVPVEGQGLSYFKWRNGVYGLMATGRDVVDSSEVSTGSTGCANRLVGAKGVIEVQVRDGPDVRLRGEETAGRWEDSEFEETGTGYEQWCNHVGDSILDVVDALKTEREPELSARKALQATELIFATYESSRRRGRVDLPLEIDDSPFLSMLNSGDVFLDG
jgi:UDP-N-acetylglucosamine 3-dehydrogenase